MPGSEQTGDPQLPQEAPYEPDGLKPLLSIVWEHPATRIFVFFTLYTVTLLGLSAAFFPDDQPRFPIPDWLIAPVVNAGFAAMALLVLWIMLRFTEHRTFREVGFEWRGLVTETAAGFLIGFALLSAVIGGMWALGIYHVAAVNPSFRPWLPLWTVSAGAIFEEIVFRGYVFRILEYRYGSLVALIVSCLIFGLIHFNNGAGATGPIFICAEAGILLAAAYMATRRLWLPIGIHLAWNFAEGPIYGANVSGTTSGTLLASKVTGPIWLSGGSFGPEASVIALTAGALAGLVMLRTAVKAGQWHGPGEWKPAKNAAVGKNLEELAAV